MVDYGLGRCKEGFGRYTTPCVTGYYDESDGFLSYNSSVIHGSGGYATEVVDELASILTSGRLGLDKRQYISSVVETSRHIDEAVRIAQKLILVSPEFHSTNIIAKETDVSRDGFTLPSPTGKPYKAVVFFMLSGGMDSYNMLMPHTCSNDLADEYLEVRSEVAIARRDMLTIEATGQVRMIYNIFSLLSIFIVILILFKLIGRFSFSTRVLGV